jgi:transposase-like protein
LADGKIERGRRLVVRNGHHQPRNVTTAAGTVEVKAPRVNDKRIDKETGERKRFSSAILPPWARKSPKISEVLPLLYLHGLSSGDFVPALEQFLGSSAGLSPATVTRLTTQWQADHKAFGERDLSAADYVYVWADGIHLRIRLEEAKAAVLVVMGVRADGTKELIAMADGYRESAESWASLLRDAARRGMRAPVLAVGDGALGFWNALHEVFPETRHQRCRVHKTANVLDSLPQSAQPAAKKAIQDIYNAEDKEHAARAVKAFSKQYKAKFPKAAKKITDDEAELLAFYDFPAEHWIHLRITNPILSTTRLSGCLQKGQCMAPTLLHEYRHRVIEVIRNSVQQRGYPPSTREIGQAVGLSSTFSVAHQLMALERKGFLRRDPHRPRAYEVRGSDQSSAQPTDTAGKPAASYVPHVGRIAAGGPNLAEESGEDLFPPPPAAPRQHRARPTAGARGRLTPTRPGAAVLGRRARQGEGWRLPFGRRSPRPRWRRWCRCRRVRRP